MSDYDHPTGLIEELLSQLADAFWWIKIYRRDKEQIVVAQMTKILTGTSVYVSRDEVRWIDTSEALSAMLADREIGEDAANLIHSDNLPDLLEKLAVAANEGPSSLYRD